MGTAASLGVTVFPTAKDFGPLLQTQISGPATEVGARTGKLFSTAFSAEAAKSGAGADAAIASAARNAQAAIESASVRVVQARAREETAAGQVRVAEQRLAEARAKYAADSSQVMSAEERLAAAKRNEGVASDTTALAQSRLSKARADGASAQVAASGAAEKEATSLGRTKTLMADTSSTIGGLINQYSKLGALIGVAIVADLGVKGVKAATDFQSSEERLVTSAGEVQANLKGVSDGILSMAGNVGYSAQQLSTGMYTVESAGYHAGDALKVMQAAAEGARTENADLTTVTDAVTSAMQDYHLKADDAAAVTSKMVTAVGDGKTTFEQLTGAMSAVLPKASAAHVNLNEILGDLSAMTLHGMSAEQASQNLADALSHLANPTLAMTKELAQLGINSADLSKNLGQTGVSGAMQEVEQSILQHMGPAGTTLLNAFNQSTQAADDANAMLKAMPPNLQKLAQSMQAGTLSQHDWTQGLKDVGPVQAGLLQQWLRGEKSATGFSDALKHGGNASQSFSQALAKATGDSSSMNVALMLTGENAAKVQQNIKDISASTTEAGGHVKGWADVQATLAQKLAELRASIGAWIIQLGTALLPIISSVVGALQQAAVWLNQNRTWIGLVLTVVGAATAAFLIWRAAIQSWTIVTNIAKAATTAWSIATAIMTGDMAALNAATDANPIMLVVLAIAALVAGLVYAYFHFQSFRAIVDDIGSFFKTVFLAVLHAVQDAIGWVTEHWKIFAVALAVAAAPITIVVGLVVLLIKHLHDIGDAALWLYNNAVKPAFDAIRGVFENAVNWILSVWRSMTGPVVAEWNKISGKLKEIWGLIVQLWNATGGRMINLITTHMGTIKRVFEAVWLLISTQLKAVWTVISGIVGGALSVVVGIIRFGWDLVRGIFKIAWDAIVTVLSIAWDVIKVVFSIAMDIIKGMFVNFWDILVGVVKIVWNIISGLINTALDIIKGILRIFVDIFTGNWSKLWTDIKAFVTTLLTDIWTIIRNVFGNIWDTIKNVLGNLFDTFKNVWNDIKTFVLNVASDIWNGLKSGIQDCVNIIGTIWDGLKKSFGTPIEFVIRTVLNNGLIAGINTLLKVVGLSIPNIPDPNLPTFATGGVVPGAGPVDSVHAMLTPGEGVLVPGAVAALGGADAILAINSTYGGGPGPTPAAGGIPGFGLGGIVSGIVGAVSSALSSLENVALGGLRAAAQGFFDSVIKPLIDEIPGGNTLPKQMMTGYVNKIETDILDFLGAKDQTAPAIGGTIPTGQRLAILTQALSADGIPQSQWTMWEAGLNTLITRESNWNAGAVNNWDSNAKAGHPSTGLMQTIIGTFEANRNPAFPDSMTDPVANVAAGVNYIMRDYGGIQNVQQANANAAPKGYDAGGLLPVGVSLAVNGTGRPEPVLTDRQWQTLRAGGGSAAGGSSTHHYHITSHDPMSVAHEIERRETAQMRARL